MPASSASIVAPTSVAPWSDRVEVVDALRGVAVAMMIAYHFCFDLTYWGWAAWPMLDDARWVAWRTAIVASFLVVVGLSLALRDERERRVPKAVALRSFVGRWLEIAAAALLVTAGSAWLFPASWIYFGVLHFVAVALWVCRRASRLGTGAIVLGLATVALGVAADAPAFDPKWINWIGFATTKPVTEDFVPLVPWLGATSIGCGLGARWARHGWRLSPAMRRAWDATPRFVRRGLIAMGRWSLTIYLVHQPLMIGAMGLVAKA